MTIIFDKSYFNDLLNMELDRPSGQLSGHNAGEPFSEKIFSFLKKKIKIKYLNSMNT